MKLCKFNDVKKSIKSLISEEYKDALKEELDSSILNDIVTEAAEQNHVNVSEDEKIKLLTYIKDLTSSEDYGDDIKNLVDQMISGMNTNTLSGVQTPDKCTGKVFDFFDVAVEKDKAFVQGVNEVLSATIRQDIIVKLKSKLLFVGNSGLERISINSEEINKELIALKKKELANLREWLYYEKGYNLSALPSDDFIMDTSNPIKERYSAYQKLMASVAKELQRYIENTPDKKVKERISEATRKNFINPLESFLLLQNFDSFVEYFIGEDINIAPKFRGDFLNQDSKKYTIKSDSYFEHSFQDDLTQDNGAHTTPHIVKLFFGTIQTGGENTEFLSNQDHRQVVSVINHMRTNEHISQELQGYLNTLFTSRDLEEEYAALINILNSKEFRNKYKESKQKALVAAIERYYKAVKNTEPLLTIEELEYFNRHRNVISALIHSIQSQKAAVFVATTENGNTINTAVERSTSKKQVYDAIKAEARKNYKSGNDVFVYSSVFSVSGGRSAQQITDLYSDAAMQMIRKILGQSISDDVLETLDVNLVGDALTSVQKLYNRYVSPYSSLQDDLLEAALNNFIKALQRDQSMKVFTDKLVEKETAQLQKIYSQEMNTLPSENIVSILTDSERNIEEYQEHFKELGIPNKNVIIKEELHKMREFMRIQSDKDKFVSHNCFRSDVKIVDENNKAKVISHTQLEPSELATVALNYDWIQSLIDGNVFFLQTETYSDKPRVLIHQYNFAEKLSTKQDPFYVKSTSALRSLHFEQQNAYYAAIENDIVNRWNALAPYLKVERFIDIESILEYLSKGLSYADFKAAIIKYQSDPKNKPINFIDHYDHLNNNGIVTMNGALLYKIKTSRDPELFNKDQEYGFNKFLESLKSNGNVLVKLSQIEDDDKLLKILGLTIDQLSKEDIKYLNQINGKTLSEEQINEILKASLDKIKSSKTWNPDHADKVNDQVIVAGKNLQGWKTSDLFKKVLKKYHATQALLQDADLQMGIKSPWLHIPKKVQYKDAATLYKMLTTNTKEADNILDNIRKHEYSQRLVAGKKRNSSGVTTFTPQKQGMRFGVPDQMKVVMAAFPTQIVENHIGIKDKGQKPHDGASVVLGIYSQFEENSYPNHDYLGTRKTIGLIPHFGSFTQVKHAENTLTNELLRGMAHRSVEYEFNPDNLIRIGYEGCKLTDKFIHNFANQENRKEFESDGVFYNFNGSIARLTNIECDEATKSFKFTWTYIEGEDLEGTEVNQSLVNQMIGLPSDANGFVKIENLLQLYKAFGSYNSMSYNEYGNIVPSEISNIVCARLISYYDVDPEKYFNDTTYVENQENVQIDMKKSMVAKIIDPESCKSGQIAVNSAKDLSEGNVAYGYLDTSRWGIQQDYTHETTDAKIPALTQVITAIAFNGNNVELVSNLYESLGKIISDSLRPILTMNGDSQQVNYYLGKKLIKSLQKNSVASNAQEIVKNFLDDLMAEMSDPKLAEDRMANGELPITLCISNSDLFYKVTSDLVANLNRDTIKQEFDGIAVIQCPSQGIVMMYEDHNGQMYKRSDVVRRAQQLLKQKSKDGVQIISFIDKNTKEQVIKDLNTTLLSEEDLLNWYFDTEEGKDLFGDVVIDKYNIDCLNIAYALESKLPYKGQIAKEVT